MPRQISEQYSYFMENPISEGSIPSSEVGLVELCVHKIGIPSVNTPGEKYSYI